MMIDVLNPACFFIHVFALFGLMLFSERYFFIRHELSSLFSLSIIAITLYCAVLFGLLQFFAIILTVLGLLYFVFYLIRIDAMVFSPLVYFIPLSVYLTTLHFHIHHADDVNYWGMITRFIAETHRLPGLNEAISNRYMSYTVGTAMLQYFFSSWPTAFYENNAFAAHTLIVISALVVGLRGQKGRNKLIAFSFVFIFAFFLDSIFFNSLAVHILLALIFAAILYEITVTKANFKDLIKLTPILIFLALVKEVGFLLSIICLLYAMLVGYFSRLTQKKYLYLLLLCAVQISILILTKQLWLWHVHKMGYSSFFNMTSSGFNLQMMYIKLVAHYIPHYLSNLATGAFHNSVWSNYSLIFHGLLIGICIFFIKMNPRSNPKISVNYRMIFVFMLSMLLFYIMLVFFFQITVFRSFVLQNNFPEASRYVSDFSAAFVFLMCFLAVNHLPYRNKYFTRGILALSSVLVLVLIFAGVF